MDKDKIESFLEELKILSLKYGIYVHGCGCCSVLKDEKGNQIEDVLYYDEELEKYV
jgi:hypothetical protein